MADFSVTIKGIEPLKRRLSPDHVDDALRPAFAAAGVIVESDAKRAAHRVTGKLQGSLGSVVEGRGFGIQARIGPQPGMGSPRHYSRSQTSRWRKPRDGMNRGNPQDYALFEEKGTRHRAGHPFLEPALVRNLERITAGIGNAIAKALRG